MAGSTLAIIGQTLKLSIGLISVPLTVGYLGKERYGLWMAAASILTFLTVIDASFVPALKNHLAEAFAHHNHGDFNRYASASLFTSALIAIFILALAPLVITVPWATFLRLRDAAAARELIPLMLVLLAMGAATLGTSFVEAIYAARLNISITLACNLVVLLVGLALLLFAIRAKASLPLLAALTGSPISLVRVFLFFRLSRKYPGMFRVHPRVAMRVVRTLLPSSIAFASLQLTNVLLSSAPNIITTRYLGIAEVTTLTVVRMLASVPLMIVAAVAPVFWPSFTIARAQGDHKGLKRRFALVLVVTAVGLVAYSVVLVIAGPATIQWWLGGRVTATGRIFATLGAWLIFQGVWYWLSTILNSMGDVTIQTIWGCIQFSVLIGCGIPMATHLGLFGLVLAMAIATAVGAVAPLAYRVRTKVQADSDEFRPSADIEAASATEVFAE
jgi:O-antigen/teichoic acid export membrane protein